MRVSTEEELGQCERETRILEDTYGLHIELWTTILWAVGRSKIGQNNA